MFQLSRKTHHANCLQGRLRHSRYFDEKLNGSHQAEDLILGAS